MMYIDRVQLKNIRCFEDLDLDLRSALGPGKFSLLLGDNGVGKTTLLRSIAMGLCDATSAGALLQELYGEWVREGANEGIIRIGLSSEKPGQNSARITTTISRTPSGYDKVRQRPSLGFPWDQIFVCGYGAARRAFSTKDYVKYEAVDAVYTLFNYDAVLQHPELILRRLDDAEVALKSLLRRIDEILMLPAGSTRLMLPAGSTKPTRAGIGVSGPWGKGMQLGALGDGYQATLAWIADLFGWALLYDISMFRNGLSGIVLIDELEQHLHPKWQRHIIELLRHQFPKIQFIATTHAPLCAAGLSDLKEEDGRLFLLRSEKEGRVKADPLSPLAGLRADQVLTSEAFGLPTTRNVAAEERLKQFRKLYLKSSLSKKEKVAFQKLRRSLERLMPEAAESERDRLMEKRLLGEVTELKKALQLAQTGKGIPLSLPSLQQSSAGQTLSPKMFEAVGSVARLEKIRTLGVRLDLRKSALRGRKKTTRLETSSR